MFKVLIFAGTRPEVVKVAPVVRLLRNQDTVHTVLVASGQHKEMLTQTLEEFALTPDIQLSAMRSGQSLGGLTARLFSSITELLETEKPDWVLVQGDTTTVFVTAVCAFYQGCQVGHIEAGLRSFQLDAPFPEEFNRRVAGIVATRHFAPTAQARDNLLREHVPDAQIVVTGNTVIDSLLWMRRHGGVSEKFLPARVKDALGMGRRLLLMTGHRRENHGQGFANVCAAIQALIQRHEDMVVVYPVHLNPNVRTPVLDLLGNHERICLLDPVGYKTFIALLDTSYVVLTDSGGVQEEAPALGKPVLVLRDVTERPEGVAAGTARLVGTDPSVIVREVSALWRDPEAYAHMAHAVNPYGDGRAAERIVTALLDNTYEPCSGPF